MGKYKYLLKNIGILTLSSIATKLISFFLLPLYTDILSTAEYGLFDLYNTTIALLFPILTLCITDSIVRFLLDKKYTHDQVVKVGLKYIVLSILVFIILIVLNNRVKLIPALDEYKILLVLMFIFNAVYSWLTGIARGLEKLKDVSIASIICSSVTIILNIIFLVCLDMRLVGYFLASIIGIGLSSVYLAIRTKSHSFIKIGSVQKNTEKEMIKYGSGLIVNSISWWINNSIDKYVVLYMIGVSANGIISIAYKLPTIIQVFQTIFEGAWILSAIKNYNENDENNFFANIYNIYNCFIVLLASLLISGTKLLASFLFKKDFFEAWQLVPFFLIALTISAPAGFAGCVFSATKNTKIISITTMIGAAANIVFNIIFIKKFGIIGAAIATMLSNVVIYIVRIIQLHRVIKIKLSLIRDVISYLLLIVQTIILFCRLSNPIFWALQVLVFIIILSMYFKELRMVIKKIWSKIARN